MEINVITPTASMLYFTTIRDYISNYPADIFFEVPYNMLYISYNADIGSRIICSTNLYIFETVWEVCQF